MNEHTFDELVWLAQAADQRRLLYKSASLGEILARYGLPATAALLAWLYARNKKDSNWFDQILLPVLAGLGTYGLGHVLFGQPRTRADELRDIVESYEPIPKAFLSPAVNRFGETVPPYISVPFQIEMER